MQLIFIPVEKMLLDQKKAQKYEFSLAIQK